MMTGRQTNSSIPIAQCNTCALQFSWLTLLVNAALGVLKSTIGLMAGSRALVASALYSINDVLSGVVVMISIRVARKSPDAEHPYGYGKAEFVAVGIVSTILVGAVIYILTHSVIAILRGVGSAPHLIVLPVAAFSMLTNFALAHRGACVAKRTESPAVQTATEHNRADAIASLATMIGVTGAAVGLHILDPIIAIFETVHIVWLSGSLFGHALRGLMDVALPPSAVGAVKRACAGVPGVVGIEALRTRQVGSYAWVDAEILVSSDTLVDDATEICREVQFAIRHAVPFSVVSQVKFRVGDQGEARNG